MVLALMCSAVIASGPVEVTEAPLVPWYVPRSASLGFFINPPGDGSGPSTTPHFRLAWEGAIVSQPRNDLIWLVSLGSGIGVAVLPSMTSHSQHVAIAGFGYRSDRPLIHWGFHVASGVAYYRATYLPGGFYKDESRVLGYIEGRLQVGVRVSGHLKLAAYFGYASPFVFSVRYPGNTFVGGFDLGLVIDWR